MNEPKKNTNVPLFIGLGAILAIAMVIVYAQRAMRAAGGPAPVADAGSTSPTGGPPLVSEAERVAYIQSHMSVDGFVVDPDTQIGPEGTTITIAGLMKAHGVVKNNGDKAIEKVIMVLTPLGADGAVLGSYREDVTLNRRLNPGEARAFEFRIPDRKELSGEYRHRLE